jgi:hypothetical protein
MPGSRCDRGVCECVTTPRDLPGSGGRQRGSPPFLAPVTTTRRVTALEPILSLARHGLGRLQRPGLAHAPASEGHGASARLGPAQAAPLPRVLLEHRQRHLQGTSRRDPLMFYTPLPAFSLTLNSLFHFILFAFRLCRLSASRRSWPSSGRGGYTPTRSIDRR